MGLGEMSGSRGGSVMGGRDKSGSGGASSGGGANQGSGRGRDRSGNAIGLSSPAFTGFNTTPAGSILNSINPGSYNFDSYTTGLDVVDRPDVSNLGAPAFAGFKTKSILDSLTNPKGLSTALDSSGTTLGTALGLDTSGWRSIFEGALRDVINNKYSSAINKNTTLGQLNPYSLGESGMQVYGRGQGTLSPGFESFLEKLDPINAKLAVTLGPALNSLNPYGQMMGIGGTALGMLGTILGYDPLKAFGSTLQNPAGTAITNIDEIIAAIAGHPGALKNAFGFDKSQYGLDISNEMGYDVNQALSNQALSNAGMLVEPGQNIFSGLTYDKARTAEIVDSLLSGTFNIAGSMGAFNQLGMALMQNPRFAQAQNIAGLINKATGLLSGIGVDSPVLDIANLASGAVSNPISSGFNVLKDALISAITGQPSGSLSAFSGLSGLGGTESTGTGGNLNNSLNSFNSSNGAGSANTFGNGGNGMADSNLLTTLSGLLGSGTSGGTLLNTLLGGTVGSDGTYSSANSIANFDNSGAQNLLYQLAQNLISGENMTAQNYSDMLRSQLNSALDPLQRQKEKDILSLNEELANRGVYDSGVGLSNIQDLYETYSNSASDLINKAITSNFALQQEGRTNEQQLGATALGTLLSNAVNAYNAQTGRYSAEKGAAYNSELLNAQEESGLGEGIGSILSMLGVGQGGLIDLATSLFGKPDEGEGLLSGLFGGKDDNNDIGTAGNYAYTPSTYTSAVNPYSSSSYTMPTTLPKTNYSSGSFYKPGSLSSKYLSTNYSLNI